jgi:hypothetical protein
MIVATAGWPSPFGTESRLCETRLVAIPIPALRVIAPTPVFLPVTLIGRIPLILLHLVGKHDTSRRNHAAYLE